MDELAVQTHCIHCLQQQFAPRVAEVSTGEHPCTWCGKKSLPMTEVEYASVMELARVRDPAYAAEVERLLSSLRDLSPGEGQP